MYAQIDFFAVSKRAFETWQFLKLTRADNLKRLKITTFSWHWVVLRYLTASVDVVLVYTSAKYLETEWLSLGPPKLHSKHFTQFKKITNNNYKIVLMLRVPSVGQVLLHILTQYFHKIDLQGDFSNASNIHTRTTDIFKACTCWKKS